jgi:LysM repeat protein
VTSSAEPTPHRRARLWLRRFTTGTTTAGVLLAGAPLVAGQSATTVAPTPGSAAAAHDEAGIELVTHRKRHPHRKIKRYRVRPGDTPSAVAVRYHAWTAELIRMNHGPTLYAGRVIRIPVVVRAAKRCTKHRHHRTNVGHHKPRPHKPRAGGGGKKNGGKGDRPRRPHAHHLRGWHHAGASRATVRRVVAAKARRAGVRPNLALAIAWQESGWQQRRVSSANAIGAMQVLPSTARWMSAYVGRRLNPRDLHHNAVAGTVLIRVLRSQAGPRRAIAGYYQGLAGVRKHGMYPSTKRYVANVLALKRRLDRGWNPS